MALFTPAESCQTRTMSAQSAPGPEPVPESAPESDAVGRRAVAARAIVTVHALGQAVGAARAAAAAGLPLLLRSAPGAGGYAGAGWFLGLVAETRRRVPDADIAGALDCGTDAATAIEALRAGAPLVGFRGEADTRALVDGIARDLGAALDEASGPALDLRGAGDPMRACAAFLAGKRQNSAPDGTPAN